MSGMRYWKRNKSYIHDQRIYANSKTYYLILMAVLCSFVFFGSVCFFIFVLSDFRYYSLQDYILLFVFIGCFFSMPLYGFTIIYSLVAKRIYIELTNEYIKVKKVFSCKSIKLSDIKSVKTIERRVKCLLIESKPIRDKSSTHKITFPVIWFNRNDILYVVDLLKHNEKSRKVIIDIFLS